MSSKKFNFSPTLFLTILLILILPNNIIAEDFQQSQTWYGNIIRELEQREYYITNSIDDNMYQSPNRAQNLRFKYYSNGFMAQPRSTKIAQFDLNDHSILDSDKTYRYIQDWQINLTLAGYGEESDLKEFSGTDLIVDENYASIEDDHMIIEYLNNEKGMRQNFILKEKLKGNDHLGLIINIETNLVMAISDQAISFSDQNGEEKLRYSSLKVWDVNNLPLEANFEKISSNTFAIIVHDEQAAYPITIDPLSTSADWSKAGGQASANFGFSVATAGDVNGDGYSDIIVGAPYYDNGYSDHGVVFGYYGSESGPSTTHDWLVGTNQKTDAHFGFSVSTAGDINGDGYSDVIIGAPGCENGQTDEGIVYIYHGSESGLTSYSTYQREVNQASAQFGFSVSTAGDVNGDGYSDIIASALYYDGGQTDEGKVFVYHGSPSGLSSTPDWDQELNQAYAQYGFAVSTAGDVNGDGYSDVIVGAPYYDNAQVDEGQVFAYYGSSGGLASDWSWYKRSNTANARFGFSVSTAGDANGDGYSDVLVGTPYWNNGMAAMYMGTSGGIYDVPIWGPSEGTTWIRFGYSLACAGDINGDGYSDVIVGAPEYSDGQTYEGRAYVYYGNSSGASSTADWTVESDQANAYLGQCVATAGDVNGDGFSDVIVGAPNYDDTQTDEGKAYLYFGSAEGPSADPNWSKVSNVANARYGYSVANAGDINGDGYSDVIVGSPYWGNGLAALYLGSSTGVNSVPDWGMNGSESDEKNGYSVSTAGDVNGDGYDDIIVGAPNLLNGVDRYGRVYVYFGSSTGILENAWIFRGYNQSNNASAQYFGYSVSTAGDVNGDGYSDIIIGQPYHDNENIYDRGLAIVYYGASSGFQDGGKFIYRGADSDSRVGASVSTAGDVNGDGFSDFIVGEMSLATLYYGTKETLSNTPAWSFNGCSPGLSDVQMVSNAGDINGDGYSDVIVGAPFYTNGQSNEGKIYIFHGSSSGLSVSPDCEIEGNITSQLFGYFVSTAGDVNGDGYSDVIIGAPGYTNGESDEGRAYLYYGSPDGLITTPAWYTKELNVNCASLGFSVSTAGDVDGDGFSDLIVGADGFFDGQSFEGLAIIYYSNSKTGPQSHLQQCQINSVTHIGPHGVASTEGEVRFCANGKSPYGRADGKFIYDYKETGIAFGANVSQSGSQSSYSDLGSTITGVELTEDVSGITAEKSYRWRARIKYNLVNNPYQSYGPWRYFSACQPESFASFKSSSLADEAPLPITLASFLAEAQNGSVFLKWTTASETENLGYILEKSTGEEQDWERVVDYMSDTTLAGHGTTTESNTYEYNDKNVHPGCTYQYRLADVDYNNMITWHDVVEITMDGEVVQIPEEFGLQTAYPNPFNPTLTVRYGLTEEAYTNVHILNLRGQKLAILQSANQSPGTYEVTWQAGDAASGVYLVEVVSGEKRDLKKVLLTK